VTTVFTIDRANEQLGQLEPLLERLRSERAELRDLKAELDEATGAERARVRLRIRGIVDQMQAAVVQVDALGIVLRDIETGLIDFPALIDGRQVWLCWRLGETDVAHWHPFDEGFGGRRPLGELRPAGGPQ
jgi:hypothetical protein